jgi:hypothetical protein
MLASSSSLLSVPTWAQSVLTDPPPEPVPNILDFGQTPLFQPPTGGNSTAEGEDEQIATMGSHGRLIGQVFNDVGQPVVGAQIRIGEAEDNEEAVLSSPITTDERGGFELLYDDPGRWMLAVWHPNYELLQTEVWIQPGLTTPVDVVLETPLMVQPRTRLGILGVGGIDRTQILGQRLAAETLRLGLVPAVEEVVALDNRRLQPVLREVGWPIYELFEWDRRRPEAVAEFFDYLGLQAIVITRVDMLNRPSSASELQLQSRSRMELWTFDEGGNLQVTVLAEASRSQTESNTLNGPEVSQLLQVQVTEMAQEVRDRWQGEGNSNPLAGYFNPDQPILSPLPSQLDTTVELQIPDALQQVPDLSSDPAPEP